ncbi:MAG: cytochrome C [Pseudomonadota bacterium]
MNKLTITILPALLLAACGGGGDSAPAAATAPEMIVVINRAPVPQPNADGAALTFTASGSIDAANPFFKAFGNGRSCASCHTQADGWSITPQGLRARFAATQGLDPVFSLNDGANSPNAPAGTIDQKRLAYSMLLTKGVIRVGLPVPSGADFTLVRADDPYGFASAAELSLFRRPLPSANLAFAASLMWDTRETFPGASMDVNLLHQANSAVRGHAQAAVDLTAAEQRTIVDFEKSLFHAQSSSSTAGDLTGLAGPARLSTQPFQAGDRIAFRLFGAWTGDQNPARAAIARGENLFNTRPMNITQVAGFAPLPQRGTCSSCHNALNTGSHSVARTFNTGVSAGILRTPDMPLYVLRNAATGEEMETTDPGVAMVTGRWGDIGRFKTPNLRGAAARAPYFHDGSARDLDAVVRFYDRRFRMGLDPQEIADMAAFLKAL